MGTEPKKSSELFDYTAQASMKQIIPLGLQHVVAAVVGIVTPALIIAGPGVASLGASETTLLIQISLICTAVGTLLQLFPIGPAGARLPIIMGTSFAYVPTLKAIGAEFDLATIFGAQIVGGCIAILFGIFLKKLRKFFPPIVTGTVIFTIGISLYPTAVNYMAGGAGNADFGSMKNWGIALLTLAVVIFCNYFTKGSARLASILIGMVVGYGISWALGMVSFDSVTTAGWFQTVRPLHFGVKFEVSACISMAVVYIVNSVQTIGDLTSLTIGGFDRNPTDRELQGGIKGQGITSVLSALMGGLPTASFSQNVGIVTVNKVVNRQVFTFSAVILLLAGFIPKIAAVLTTVPYCVIGGATVSVFATISMTGIKMIASEKLTNRNTAIVGLAVALGVGVTSVGDVFAGFPGWVSTVFGSSSVVIATIVAVGLNLIIPKEETQLQVVEENEILRLKEKRRQAGKVRADQH